MLSKLVGHSMGGSVLVRAASRLISAKYRLTGVAVLDVVEGFTLDALPHMHSLLDTRPDGFDSLEEAIEWQYVLFLFVPSCHIIISYSDLCARRDQPYNSNDPQSDLRTNKCTGYLGACQL